MAEMNELKRGDNVTWRGKDASVIKIGWLLVKIIVFGDDKAMWVSSKELTKK